MPRDNQFSMDLFARAIEAVRAEAGADRVVLAGHSMGVPVIRHYARMYPQHAAALVFVDGPLNRPGNLPANFGQQMGGPDGLKARENLIRSMFSSATIPEMQKHILDMMLAAPEATAVGAIQATFDPAVWKDEMFTGAVLGIYTEGAGATNRDALKRFPNSDYHEMPGAGHFLMVEKPAEFNRLMIDFLKKQRF
jgi:pimeloyl-ACP methyl ester carboxylesterase